MIASLGSFAQIGNAPDALTYLQYDKIRVGGYGEMLYQHMDFHANQNSSANGAVADNRSVISVPRAVFSFEYKFTPTLEFGAELEIEHLGTGTALEMEYEEGGEYEAEVEKGGEVALEQIHLTKTFAPWLRVRAGHLIVPIGVTNQRHLPHQFLGTVRPEAETTILPSTWHESGIAILGAYRKWSYQIQCISGLNPNGFERKGWIKNGKQTKMETAIMTNPAFVGRVESRHLDHLILGASVYRGNTTKNTLKPEFFNDDEKGALTIYSGDFSFNNNKIIARGNFIYGDLENAAKITSVNTNISAKSQFKRTPVARSAMSFGVEAGVNLLGWGKERTTKLIPFARYEKYDSMFKTDPGITKDQRCNREKWSVGLNYFLTPTVGVKMDYSQRSFGDSNIRKENTFGIAIVYSGWFVSK